MGLFGGFKGKLIRKEKKPKGGGAPVVCVKFNAFSEFDAPSGSFPSTSNGNIGPTEVVKERRRPTKPEIKNIFTPQINGDVERSHSVRSEPETVVTPPTPTITPPTSTITSPANASIPPEREERKPAPPPPAKAAPPPPVKAETPKPKTPPPEEVDVTPVVFDRSPRIPVESSDSESDDGNFQIHVNQNVNHFASSEEESEVEEDVDSAPIDYSSQAASIFFGGEEEPVVRPRNVVFEDDDDDDDEKSDGSSASA